MDGIGIVRFLSETAGVLRDLFEVRLAMGGRGAGGEEGGVFVLFHGLVLV